MIQATCKDFLHVAFFITISPRRGAKPADGLSLYQAEKRSVTMANIFTRKAVNGILADENLTAEEKTERLFSLYGQALDDGYLSKSAAQAAQATAIETAKAEAIKSVQAPDVTQSAEYKQLAQERDMLRAIGGDDFSTVKPKFRETVFGMLDRSEKAPAIADQLKTIGEKYEEYFVPAQQQEQPVKPSFGAPTQGSAPTGKTGPSFMDTWGFVPKKQ